MLGNERREEVPALVPETTQRREETGIVDAVAEAAVAGWIFRLQMARQRVPEAAGEWRRIGILIEDRGAEEVRKQQVERERGVADDARLQRNPVALLGNPPLLFLPVDLAVIALGLFALQESGLHHDALGLNIDDGARLFAVAALGEAADGIAALHFDPGPFLGELLALCLDRLLLEGVELRLVGETAPIVRSVGHR